MRIVSALVDATIEGRNVQIQFRSPTRWKIFEDGKNVTRQFAHMSFREFHDAVDAGETRCLLGIKRAA